jgi:hypothetical protein
MNAPGAGAAVEARSVRREARSGLFAAGGRARLRVRETYLRDVTAPLLSRGAAGAVKLDLVLRSLGFSDPNCRGLVPESLSWEQLHDWCRPVENFAETDGALKRKWVSDKLETLESLGCLIRTPRPGTRPRIVMLSDAMNGAALDDPGEAVGADDDVSSAATTVADRHGVATDSYVTVLCEGFEYKRFTRWEGPEFAAYFSAMIAERYARADPLLGWLLGSRPTGHGIWFRNLEWFGDRAGDRPAHHVRIPFSVRTLSRGYVSLRQEGLIATVRVDIDPRTGRRFKSSHGRVFYFNGFDDMRRRRPRFPADPARLRLLLEPTHLEAEGLRSIDAS